MPFTTCCSRHRGFTALELIIVLVIGFSILALSASKIGELFTSSKATQAVDAILNLSRAMHEFKGSPEFNPASTDIISDLRGAELIPKSIKMVGNNLEGIWTGNITITYANNTTSITYPNVPKSPCMKIVRGLLPSGFVDSIQGTGNPLTANTQTPNITAACTPAQSATSVDLIIAI